MSEAEVHPGKPVRDPASYQLALQTWMRGQRPGAHALEVVDVDMPQATGFSNETVFFSARWREEGRDRTQRYVARIEPEGGGLFPVQTPACRNSVALQHRIMQAISTSGVAPVPPLLPLEEDSSVLGSPFFVMEFVPGRIPADVGRYPADAGRTPAEVGRPALVGPNGKERERGRRHKGTPESALMFVFQKLIKYSKIPAPKIKRFFEHYNNARLR